MKRSHLTCIVLASLTFSLFGPTANADMKVGGACKKLGETAVDPSGFKHKCLKSGKKLIWDGGIKLGDSGSQKKVDPGASSSSWPSSNAEYITAVPVDLDQINSISKYASCSGHNRDGYTFEKVLTSNLSLKHYWYPIAVFQGTTDQVKVFAPFDGIVSIIQLEANKGALGRPKTGNGLGLSTSVDKNVVFEFGHIYFTKSFKVGDSVRSGQLLGYAALGDPGFDFDIDLTGKSRAPDGAEILGSIFDHMSKKVLDAFAVHGITPAEMKISIADRKKQPCDFNSGTGRTTADWVALKGESIKTTVSSSQSNSGNSGNGAKPIETQKPNTPTDIGNPAFQELGAKCDPSKVASGKAMDGTQLMCIAISAAEGSWQKK